MQDSSSTPTSALSQRGSAVADASPVPEYLVEHSKHSIHPGPMGYTPLCVAENRLVWDLLEPRMTAARAVPHEALCYDHMIGSQGFRKQLAVFMGRCFLGRVFDLTQIAVLAGAGSVLEILFYVLGDPGDGVLVPTPSYAGFWLDLETRDQLSIIPVHGRSDDRFRLTPELLDKAVATAKRPVRALLFTSPNNPLGRVYSRDEVLEVLDWAEGAGIHIIFDEIFALSVFGDRTFTSCAELHPQLGDGVHIVWAFSKDFGASGLRCGVLVSENRQLMEAVDAIRCMGSVLQRRS